MFNNQGILAGAVLCVLLGGCGGSSLENDSGTTTPAVLVNAGPDLSINEQSTVNLAATIKGNSASYTYAWSATPGLSIDHPDTTAATASLVTPTTTTTDTYTLTLVVTDAAGNRGEDRVQLTVQPVNAAPTAQISHNQVQNLAVRQYPAGFAIELDGSGSLDSDATAGAEQIASWLWQQTSGTDLLTDIEVNDFKLAFSAPVEGERSTLSFTLTVTDQEGATDTASITLTIQSEEESLPIVDAGVDHEVFSGESIILNSKAVTHVPSALPFSYKWAAIGYPDLIIDDARQAQTFAIAPAVTETTKIDFDLLVTDQFGNKVEDQLTVTVKPIPIKLINDTGVTTQGNASGNSSGHQAGFPGQDGQRGQDIIHQRGFYEKAGRGAGGFDFTRLNENGDEVDNTSLDWRCVRDNVTGLIWEKKVSSPALFDPANSYTWYFSEDNGGTEGSLGTSLTCSLAECNTEAYITQVNTQGLCGFYDWRLPTHNELLSILHLGKSSLPLIDEDYFPATTARSMAPLWYWTRTPSIDGAADETAQNAWAIDFATGVDHFLNKSTTAHVRLVRAGR